MKSRIAPTEFDQDWRKRLVWGEVHDENCYVLGGISPVGQKNAHPTVLDETAELYDTVFVSGGRRGFDIELAPAHLVLITNAVVAAIARD